MNENWVGLAVVVACGVGYAAGARMGRDSVRSMLAVVFLVACLVGNMYRPARLFFGMPDTANNETVVLAPNEAPAYYFANGASVPFRSFLWLWSCDVSWPDMASYDDASGAWFTVGGIVGIIGCFFAYIFYLAFWINIACLIGGWDRKEDEDDGQDLQD